MNKLLGEAPTYIPSSASKIYATVASCGTGTNTVYTTAVNKFSIRL
jgi:hypothetical protein